MYSIGEIAERLDLRFEGDGSLVIRGLCGLSDDRPERLAFVARPRHVAAARESAIPAFVTRPDLVIEGKTCLFHPHPEYAMALIARLFEPSRLTQAAPIDITAVIHPTASLGEDVTVGAHVTIGAGATIGRGCRLYPGVVVMDRARLDDECVLYPNAVVREDCVLGKRVILQPGAVIGGDGYGFVHHAGHHVKIPQLGNVVLEDDVEVGANTTIDRGRFTETRVGRGTKVDNLVMLAHNVQTGEDCLIVAQTGISGSTRLGDRVVLAGQVGVAGHIEIGSDITVLGKSVISKHVLRPGTYAGIPIRPVTEWRRAIARFYREQRAERGDEPA